MGEASLAEAGQTASVDEFREFNRKSFSEYSRASCEEDVQQSLATLAGSGPIGRKPSKPSLDDLVCADRKPSLDDLIRNVSTSSPRAQEPLAERRRRGGVDHRHGRASFDLLKSRPSRIVMPSAFALSVAAGCTNATTMAGALSGRGVGAVGVTHVTGAVTKMGLWLGANQSGATASCLAAGGFALGAVVAGLVTPTGVFSHERLPLYGRVMVLVATMLAVSAALGELEWCWCSVVLAGAACGAQNGMVTTVTTCIVRTTHLTGVATDLGLLAGRSLSRIVAGKPRCVWITDAELHRAKVLSLILLGFILGASAGAALVLRLELKKARTLLVPAVFQLGLAIVALCANTRNHSKVLANQTNIAVQPNRHAARV